MRRAPDGRAAAAGAGLLLAALVAAAFWPVLFAGRTLSPAAYVPGVLPSGPVAAAVPPPTPLRDLEGGAWVDEPAPYLVHRPLAALRAPLWNPAVGLGAPLAANPNMAAWSPLQLPANLLPTPLVQDLTWVLRVYLLAFFTWTLAWTLGCGFVASFAAAAGLALSGQTLDWLVHHPLNTDVFVPGALAAALWVLRGRRGAYVALVLLVAAALLGVKPQSALTAALFGTVFLAAAAYDERLLEERCAAARCGRVVLAIVLAAALAGIALVPFLESYAAASGLVRAGRSTQSEWALPLQEIAGLAGPWARHVTSGDGAAVLAGPPHAGVVVLLLACVGTWRARRRAVTWALLATVVLYLARIFGALPIPLAGVPILGSVSFVKYCFPLYLALVLLAALALAPGAARGAGPRLPKRAGLGACLGALAIVAELLWLGARPRPLRLDPYAPAPYVKALRTLAATTPGRISGPVDLAPPLVSAVLGFRDLRAIDVLTPRDGYDFVSQVVAPSEGITWILADPDPLLAATAPGAAAADLRWILARGELDGARLADAVRSAIAGRRLLRLFAALRAYRIDSAALGGGIHELDGDRRFHWSCATPCRFTLELERSPRRLAAGFASTDLEQAEVALTLRAAGHENRATAVLSLRGAQRWADVWVDGVASTDAAQGPATVQVEITSPAPGTIFVGGLGPAPGPHEEDLEAQAEVAFRRRVLDGLRLRHADETARIYENPGALGEVHLATDVALATGMDQVRACLTAHPDRAVACVADPDAFPAAPADVSPGAARVVTSDDAELVVAVDAARDGLLVVSRLDFPGWRATVDGKGATIARVNGAMMGVVVPRGTHRVELKYRPRSLLVGAVVSLLGLLALVISGRASGRAFEG